MPNINRNSSLSLTRVVPNKQRSVSPISLTQTMQKHEHDQSKEQQIKESLKLNSSRNALLSTYSHQGHSSSINEEHKSLISYVDFVIKQKNEKIIENQLNKP